MRRIRIVLLALIALIQPAAYSAVTKLVVDIPTRPGLTVRILYNAHDSPTAHLVLFPGNFVNGLYDGYLGIQLDGSMIYAPPEVDQSISDWIARGVSFTVVDPPIDRQSLDAFFRRSAEHTADMLAVVRYLQQLTPVPVLVMGLGSGAISAASVTAGLGRDVPLGAILGTPHTVGGNALTAEDLAPVYSPTLVINHTQDACPCCPPGNVPMLVAALVNAAAVEHVALVGGSVSMNPCDDVAGPDGWGGLWPLGMDTIVGWIYGHINLLQAPPATSPDLNQHGLTGSWYEPASDGQGFAVQVIPDQSPGNGLAFVSWFTFDTVIGGAERQRWYTLQGPVVTGQPSASLTIYQNTGGNFNAPPATNPQAVGTATLSFATCSSGSLSYTFTDGSGRTGTIALTRLLPNVTCSVATPHPTNADFALSGSWYAGAATSGQGFTAEVAPSSSAFFLSWFTYMPNGANAGAAGQRWYTAQGDFTPGLRTIPVLIYETTGGKFDTSTPPDQARVKVGTGTMAFQSCSAATFDYNFTGGSSNGQSGTITLGRVGPVPPGCTPAPVTIVAAGDIAQCGNAPAAASAAARTAALIDAQDTLVLTLGDNAYDSGKAAEFASCFQPTWGAFKDRIRPSPGNHDYGTSGAEGYFGYFGAQAGPDRRGYYSFDYGGWHFISLNSQVDVSPESEQYLWLTADLAKSRDSLCTIAYWHYPAFNSGARHGSIEAMRPFFDALYTAGVEMVLSGHEHIYERFAPQTGNGTADPARGVRQFVVGTGGARLYPLGHPIPNSEYRNNTTWGVLRLTLDQGSYSWRFMPDGGGDAIDSGTGICHP